MYHSTSQQETLQLNEYSAFHSRRLRRSPEGGNDNPLQYSCLKNPTDREAWKTTVHGVAKESDMI